MAEMLFLSEKQLQLSQLAKAGHSLLPLPSDNGSRFQRTRLELKNSFFIFA